jgi:hypothetical protein
VKWGDLHGEEEQEEQEGQEEEQEEVALRLGGSGVTVLTAQAKADHHEGRRR